MSLLIALSLTGVIIQTAASPSTARVSGRVLEEGSRAPIAGAEVMLIRDGSDAGSVAFLNRPRTSTTDSDGRYEFDRLAAGRYRIIVQKAGFARPHDVGGLEVQLEPGGRRADLETTLQKGAVIVGRVLDDAGEPLVNAQVNAMRKPAVPMAAASMRRDILIPAGPGAQTNDLGEFRLFSLPPGEYYVQATPRFDFGGSAAPRATTMLPTYSRGRPIRLPRSRSASVRVRPPPTSRSA